MAATREEQVSEKFTPIDPQKDEVEILQDEAHRRDLVLVLKVNGKQEIITEAEIEELLQFKKNPAQDQGQHGVKSAKDLISLLKSPLGDKNKAAKRDEILLLRALKMEQDKQSVRAEYLRELNLANIKLLSMLEREEHAKEVNLAWQQDINKTLAYSRAVAQQAIARRHTDSAGDALRKQLLEAYDLAPKIIQAELDELIKESAEHEQAMAEHEEEHREILNRYDTLDAHIRELDKHWDSLESIERREARVAAVQAVLTIVRAGKKEFTQKIQDHIAKGEDAQANHLMENLDGLSVQEEGLESMISVINEEKTYYDDKGQTSYTDENNTIKPVTFKNATYVIVAQKKLVQDPESGKFYVLAKDQDLSSLTAEEKSSAQLEFEETKHELTAVRETVKQYKSNEVAVSESTTIQMKTRAEEFQTDILQKSNELSQANADKARIEGKLSDPSFDPSKMSMPVPRPTPSSQTKGKINTTPAKTIVQDVVELGVGNVKPEAVGRLMKSLGNNKQAQDIATNYLKPGELLTPMKRQALLRDLPRFGVDVNKPNVTSIPDKHPSNAPEETPEESPRSSPGKF